MNVLYYYPSTLTVPNFQVLIDELLVNINSGDQIYLAKCNGAIRYCESNPYGSSVICKLCNKNFDIVINKYKLKDKITVLDLKHFLSRPRKREKINERDFNKLKRVQYKQYNIGFGVISSFVSRIRNVQAQSKHEIRLLENYFAGGKNVVDYLIEFCSKYQFDKIVFYNGRLHSISPLLQLVKKEKLLFEILEVIGGRDGSGLRKQKYFNTTPFNRIDFAGYINENWKLHSNEERQRLSHSFFESKRKGIPVLDKSYTVNQTSAKHLITNKQGKRITIFNSSPDESASLGEDWEWTFNGTNDEVAITEMIVKELKNENCEIYFRMHPNLKNYKGNLEQRLSGIESKYDNFYLIKATDTASSYQLMDASDYVVTFGSSIGVESTYWGKVTIIIGKSFYDYLNIAYKTESLEDFKKIITQSIKPKPKDDTLKWALFYTNRIYNTSQFKNNIPSNLRVEGKFFGLTSIKRVNSFGAIAYGLNNVLSRVILHAQRLLGSLR